MRIEIFQSSHGDCLLLESADGKRILCDGGMRNAMEEFVAPALGKLRDDEPNRPIDLVYISHIDADHIGGVVQLLEDALEWKVHDHHDHHVPQGDEFDPPGRPRPPRISHIWHNAFKDVVDRQGEIEDLLAAAAPVMAATQSAFGIQTAFDMQQIALGVDHAIRVSKMIKSELLDIRLNDIGGAAPAKLLMVRPGQPPIRLGGFEITIVGPTEAQLKDLRKGWNHWVDRSREKIDEINREIRRVIDEFATSSDPGSIALHDWEGVPGFRNVTVPNLASLVLFVREGNRTLLLTGDVQHDLLIDELEEAGLMPNGHLHVDVLKVQHHGSENNMSRKFARTVSADHYIFCGNGANGNPERQVIKQIFDSRISNDPDIRARAPEAQQPNRPFHFWFSTASTVPSTDISHANFKNREELVSDLKARSNNRLKTHFNKHTSIKLQL
jgi:Metallo-beta-lactamase superfamily